MIDFEIHNSTKVRLNRKLIKGAVLAFSSIARIKKANFSLAFVSGSEIKKLNNRYRKKDKVTDVLSFAEDIDDFISQDNNREGRYLGEIVICPSKAKSQSKEYNWSLNKEFVRLLIHGLAHLIGHDHENVSARKAQKMQLFEREVMVKMGLIDKKLI